MRLCEVEGCGRKHVARGMCQAHYLKRQREEHGRLDRKQQIPCAACGEVMLKVPSGRYRQVCSTRCRYFITYGRWPAGTDVVGPLPRDPKPSPTHVPVEIIGAKTRFLDCTCEWCGQRFTHDLRVTGAIPNYCTKRCQKAKGRNLRKARECGATGSYTLAEVLRLWLAFDKRCAYCEQPTDGLPDPDHVNPLSRGGSNSITNILPSCRLCNSDKNDMTLDEWAVDRIRRGKDPRVTAWAVGDHRVAHLVLSQPTRASKVGRLAA